MNDTKRSGAWKRGGAGRTGSSTRGGASLGGWPVKGLERPGYESGGPRGPRDDRPAERKSSEI